MRSMARWIVFIGTALALAYLGRVLSVAWDAGNYWVFPVLIYVALWYGYKSGTPEDRADYHAVAGWITRKLRLR